MNYEENFKDIMLYALSLARVSLDNIETGFLTGIILNRLSDEESNEYGAMTQMTVTEYCKALVKMLDDNEPTDYDYRTLYMYMFDKHTELAIKMINGYELDTKLTLREPFEYYEPDLPAHIQLKLTKVVGPVTIIGDKVRAYINKKGYYKEDKSIYLTHYFLTACTLAFRFATEMDFDNDSELMHYLLDEA